jgi:hypothetical protein
VDSRDRPIPNAVRTPKSAAAVPVKPKKTTLSTSSPNQLLSHNLPGSANATQPESSGGSDFEAFDLSKGIDELKSTLLEYGRSIIRSAMDQDQDQDAQNPETEIIIAKERVIAHYVNTAQSLSEDLDLVKEVLSEQQAKIGRLEEIAALEEEKSSRIQDLELEVELLKCEAKEGEGHLAEMKRYQGLWEEDQETKKRLEAEVAGLKQDHKRKRDKMDELWKKMEMAVEQ